MRSLGIIGGGITGLSAAYHLRPAGYAVSIYEASERTGGVICSHREGDWLAEGGPNTILETSPEIAALVQELGLADRRQYSDPRADARFVVRGGRAVQLPATPLQFFLAPFFSWTAKMSLLAEPFRPRRRGSDEESVAGFVRRRLGQEFLDYGIDPLVTGIYAGDPAQLSIEHAFPRIHALEAKYGSLIRGQFLGARERRKRGDVAKDRARKFSFDDGLQVLPDTLARKLGDCLRRGTRVTRAARTASGWRLSVESPSGAATAAHDAVLFCGTAHSLARLELASDGVPDLALLGAVHYPPVTSVVLGFRRSDVAHPCQGFGMLIPHGEGFGILGTLFSSALFPRRAPTGHVTLTTYVGGVRNPSVAALDDEMLVDLTVRELGRLLGVTGRPVFRHLTRWPHAIPQYNLGYGRVKERLAELESRAPGFFVTGHFRDGVALSDSLLNGRKVADRIATHFRSAAPAAA